MTHNIFTHNKVWQKLLVSVLLLGVLAACGTSTTSTDIDSNDITLPDCNLEETLAASQIADDVIGDVGQLETESDGDECQRVIIFEENHASNAGQIEIAIMLNRLYQEHGLRHLALEGAVVEEDAPNANWFHEFPDESIRYEVALQLLAQGEVSAAGFMALVYSDFQLHPIERRSEYEAELSDGASVSQLFYLLAIAEQSLTSAQIEEAIRISEDDINNYIDFVIAADPWVQSRYDSQSDLSAEEWIELVDEIDARADEVGATQVITFGIEDIKEYSDEFQELRGFFVTASKRSDTMVANTVPIVNSNSEAPIAFIIGAAHTDRVVELLEGRSISFAIISPLALANDEENGVIYSIAYDRKLLGQSVDQPGELGAYLDGRRKPPSNLNASWLRHKGPIMGGAVAITRAANAAAGAPPPFDLDNSYLSWDGGEFDLSSIEVLDDDDVIFAVNLFEPKEITLWFRTRLTDSVSEISDAVSLEQALVELLAQARQEEPLDFEEQEELESEYSENNPATTAFGRDVIGKASISERAIRATDI